MRVLESVTEPLIEINQIAYKYQGQDDRKALDDVSLKVFPNEWVALIGHNGSGKSTLAKTINGLILPDEGTITIKGKPLKEETIWDVRRTIGMVFQNPDNQFVGSTVEDDVAFGLENQGIPREDMLQRVSQALEQVRMSEFSTKEPARLSGGQKQRVAIAGVIALRPDVIILDEATSMLDPQGRREVIETIEKIKEEENLTVISITHDIDEAANASRVLVMKQGTIIKEGTPEAIFSEGDKLIEWGLDVPFPEKLKSALAKKGVTVPEGYLTEEGLVDWLWTSSLKK
ncbi:energy-coupling factor ABC transporter ATP-binding protein [Vagococcus acidifermentans]|uniref:Energy-coupling factor transporter ATPase n=1 Tax=Vagococcus acidifermentans TaxID=564710 RepID=A0A430B3A6_9ENTE|nr:energy-coupling factor ABC transporter ATP-binding protein [Vagococcus acidifermentans]RSU14810.1 energy-coupling factor transporter ATPase [Vagococcus acidifermentans]HHV42450.1 energy-coupling factor ABC transporter ATP-binding protein [Clostridiaceae bacterium]